MSVRRRVTHVVYSAEGWGVGELWLDGDRLLEHALPRPSNGPLRGEIGELAGRFHRYFAGERVSFDDVALELNGATAFQRAVTRALRAVPYGETVTYGELAALAGYPNAQRAVGTFCARNRFGLVVPCHRVVASDGVGPYGSLGSDYKRRLLDLEHVFV